MNDGVYLVYEDLSYPGNSETGLHQYLIAKNRKEAAKKATIPFTHVKWLSTYRCEQGRIFDSYGKEVKIKVEVEL